MSIEQHNTVNIGEDYRHPANTFEDRFYSFTRKNREMLFNINGIYAEALDYISRFADYQDELGIRDNLATQIAESYNTQKQVGPSVDETQFTSERNMYRQMYWAHLEAISMNPVIQDMLQSDSAQEAYAVGYNGGQESEKYTELSDNEHLFGSFKEIVNTLFNLDPRLVNKKKLYNTFVDQNYSLIQSNEAKWHILEELGMGFETPEGKITILSNLYLHEKRVFYSQLINTIRNFRSKSDAKLYSQKVSLAHMKQNAIEETILHFEQTRGYLDLVQDAIQYNLQQIPVAGNTPQEQETNRYTWLKSFHLGLFLRSSTLPPEVAKNLQAYIFKLVKEQNFNEIQQSVTYLANQYPNMYHDFMWRSLGVDIVSIRKEFEEKRQIAVQQAKESKEQQQKIKEEKRLEIILQRHAQASAENNELINQIPAELYGKKVKLTDGSTLIIYEPKLQKKGGIKGIRKEGELSRAPEIYYIPFNRTDIEGNNIGRGTRSAKSILELLQGGYTLIE